jgi:CRP-like cAMP-binding protein
MITPRSKLLKSIFLNGKYRKINKGESLKSSDENQDIILVDKGFIKRYMISNNGTLGTQIIYSSHDIFPLTKVYSTLLEQSLYSGAEVYHYSAMTDSWVYELTSDVFALEVSRNTDLYKDLLSEAGFHLATTIQRLENAAIGNSYSRVCHILLFYSGKFGKVIDKGIRIEVPLSHQDIADILNVTRETVTMAFIKLRKKNLIITRNRHTILTDVDRLYLEIYD